jgi:hypothetical protein
MTERNFLRSCTCSLPRRLCLKSLVELATSVTCASGTCDFERMFHRDTIPESSGNYYPHESSRCDGFVMRPCSKRCNQQVNGAGQQVLQLAVKSSTFRNFPNGSESLLSSSKPARDGLAPPRVCSTRTRFRHTFHQLSCGEFDSAACALCWRGTFGEQ